MSLSPETISTSQPFFEAARESVPITSSAS